eukprot:gene5593-6961_t
MNPNAAVFVPKFLAKPAAPAATEPEAAVVEEKKVVEPTPKPTTTTTTSTKTTSPTTENKKPTESVFVIEDDDFEDEEDEVAESTAKLSINQKSEAELKPEDAREHVNLVFLGHVDAGKSTISGNIMLLTGQVNAHTLAKYEKEAKENNRESWIFAYILDTNEEERARGKTVEVGRAHFETEKKRYTILDAPGHSLYVPNMIVGAVQADVGILVISSKRGEFEAGVDGGQTIEHARLAKMIGIKHLIVLVNKMDEGTVNWSQDRYNEIVEKITGHLKKCGYNQSKGDFQFVAGSGFTSANIKDPVSQKLCPWYQGPTLIGALDNLAPIERNVTGPLRVPVITTYKERYINVMGKIESGTASVGQQVYVMPAKVKAEIISLTGDVCTFKNAKPGENIRISLKGIEEDQIRPGSMICDINKPVPTVTAIECIVSILAPIPGTIIFAANHRAVFHAHAAVEEVKVKSLLAIVDPRTGEVIKNKPSFAKVNQSVKCRLVFNRPICVEDFATNPQLSRFTLRDRDKTIAFGKIVALGKKRDPSQINQEDD